MDYEKAKRAVVTVGEARGFVVRDEREPSMPRLFVITAAHCLPFFPPCASQSHTEDRTYKKLLGPLGEKATVWAECLFADPVGDIAVLGSPDNQELQSEADRYDALTGAAIPLPIGNAPEDGQALLLSLDGRWFRCTAQHSGAALWLFSAAEGIVGGMSGSPIVAEDGSAIGVVCNAAGGQDGVQRDSGPAPRLAYHLPAGLCPKGILNRA
jgi:hypothetical protein